MTTATATNPDIKIRESVRVHLRAATLDEGKRTVEAVLATETPVKMWGATEILVISGIKYADQVVLLDSHSRYSISDIVGSISGIHIDGDKLIGTLRIAEGEKGDQAITLIRGGHLTDVSVGYSIDSETMVQNGQKAIINGREYTASDSGPLYVVTESTLKEVSLVPIGADPAAKMRAEDSKFSNGRNSGDSPSKEVPQMEPVEKTPEPEPAERSILDRVETAVLDFTAIEKRAAELFAQRNAAITEVCTLAGVDSARTLDYITGDKTVEQIRAELVKERAEKQKPVAVSIEVTRDARDTFRERAIAGLQIRAGHKLDKAAEEKGREYAGISLFELAQESLRAAGQPVPLGKENVLRAAMSGRARDFRAQGERASIAYNHTTSDFANILADVTNKSLQKGYAEAPVTYPLWVRTVPFSDFKDRKVNALSEAPDPQLVREDGEIPEVTLSERAESYGIDTYASIISITRQTIINDDLGAFTRIPMIMGAAMRRKIQKLVSAILNEGDIDVLMSDGAALFVDAGHANYGTTSTALAENTLQAGITAMRNQTGLGGQRIAVRPRYLIVPNELEFTAAKLLNSTASTAASGNSGIVNTLQGYLTLIVDSFLGDATANGTTAWYLAAANNEIDTIELGLLNGVDAASLEEEAGFDVLGMRFRAYSDFGAKAIDWRGLYKVTGAGSG